MPKFERLGRKILDVDGMTKEQDIRLSNNSHIFITAGYGPMVDHNKNFRLKFSNEANDGWVLDTQSLDELIIELLFMRKDLVGPVMEVEDDEEEDAPF